VRIIRNGKAFLPIQAGKVPCAPLLAYLTTELIVGMIANGESAAAL
jgi:hypothetical protein